MQNSSKFQLIVTGFFAGLIVIGVLVFAFSKGRSTPQVSLLVWGTVSADSFNRVYNESALSNDRNLKVLYIQKDKDIFTRDFVEALASGTGPDIIFVPHEVILRNKERLLTIPFSSISERTYRDTFAEASEVFLKTDGMIALPVVIDPLVMYWNRDIFTNAGISMPPRQWSEFYNLSTNLTQKDGALNISKSAAPLGEFRNVRNSKEIISTLFFQAGNPVTVPSGASFVSVLTERFNSVVPPAETALTFYTEFSNPTKVFHSWNRSLPDSQDYFLAGNLAVYFGFASEAPILRFKNPNLNFDIASIPQSQSATRNMTFGRVYAFSIPRASRNIPSAFNAVFVLAGQSNAGKFAQSFSSAPARRDLLAVKPTDSFGSITYDSALWSRAWHDPNYEETENIFREMVESVTGGRSRIVESVLTAHRSLTTLLQR